MTVDIICHGVPSPEVFQGWLSELEHARGTRVARYEHRPKSKGWGHSERVTFSDGRVEQGTRLVETWKRLFYANRMLRPSCYRCPCTTVAGRPGDLTIADFWGVEATPHAHRDDTELGASLVLANGRNGLRLLSGLDIECEVASVAEALPRNPMLEHPSTYKGERRTPWDELYKVGLLAMVKSQSHLASFPRFFALRIRKALKRTMER